MPKVKIIACSLRDYDNYDCYSTDIIRAGITDWEEISDEDYEFLIKKKYLLASEMKLASGMSVEIIKQDEMKLPDRIDSLKAFVQKIEDNLKKEEDARIAKKEAAAVARKLKKEAKTKEEELALLAALTQKHGIPV